MKMMNQIKNDYAITFSYDDCVEKCVQLQINRNELFSVWIALTHINEKRKGLKYGVAKLILKIHIKLKLSKKIKSLKRKKSILHSS